MVDKTLKIRNLLLLPQHPEAMLRELVCPPIFLMDCNVVYIACISGYGANKNTTLLRMLFYIKKKNLQAVFRNMFQNFPATDNVKTACRVFSAIKKLKFLRYITAKKIARYRSLICSRKNL